MKTETGEWIENFMAEVNTNNDPELNKEVQATFEKAKRKAASKNRIETAAARYIFR